MYYCYDGDDNDDVYYYYHYYLVALWVPGLNRTISCNCNITYLQSTLSSYCTFNCSLLEASTTQVSTYEGHICQPLERKSQPTCFSKFHDDWQSIRNNIQESL